MRFKAFVFATSTILVSVVGFLLVAELVLRFLPVGTGLHTQAVNARDSIPRFEPNRQFIFSREWNFAIVNRGRVNNAGFINNQDYRTNDPRPLIAVIGDSFIEAQMVPYPQTMHGRLQAQLSDLARVYSFGASGAPLSQYLAIAEHVREEYRPRMIVFTVVGNDFDESLYKYKPNSAMHTYDLNDDGDLVLRAPGQYHPSFIRRLLRQSSLVRYLAFNLKVSKAYWVLRHFWHTQEAEYAGNSLADASPERVADATDAIEAFFRDLPQYSGLLPESIVFVVDGVRDMIYDSQYNQTMKESYVYVMRHRFITIARDAGYEVVDLHRRFAEHFAEHGQRFEFETDGHWNGLGHAVAAEAVHASDAFQRLATEISADAVSSAGSSYGFDLALPTP